MPQVSMMGPKVIPKIYEMLAFPIFKQQNNKKLKSNKAVNNLKTTEKKQI